MRLIPRQDVPLRIDVADGRDRNVAVRIHAGAGPTATPAGRRNGVPGSAPKVVRRLVFGLRPRPGQRRHVEAPLGEETDWTECRSTALTDLSKEHGARRDGLLQGHHARAGGGRHRTHDPMLRVRRVTRIGRVGLQQSQLRQRCQDGAEHNGLTETDDVVERFTRSRLSDNGPGRPEPPGSVHRGRQAQGIEHAGFVQRRCVATLKHPAVRQIQQLAGDRLRRQHDRGARQHQGSYQSQRFPTTLHRPFLLQVHLVSPRPKKAREA